MPPQQHFRSPDEKRKRKYIYTSNSPPRPPKTALQRNLTFANITTNKKTNFVRNRHRPPALVRRVTPHKHPKLRSPNGTGLSLAPDKAQEQDDDGDDDDEDMAGSFLQFCATCDKQMATSTRTNIYCSDNCRKRDEDESIRIPLSRSSASCISLPSLSNLTTVFDEQGRPPRNIVAPASPTARTYPSPPFDPLERDSPPPSDKAVLSSSVAASPPRHLSARPLPPRQNPLTFSGSPRSIDLVNPFASHYGASFAATAAPFSMPASLDDTVRWGNPGALEPLQLLNIQGVVNGNSDAAGSALLASKRRSAEVPYRYCK
ncbi:MAG: hypothetical protein M1815_005781 [Lichina confinis]|nr:MAG: hypothetical protein M1815_005781 [Lichina confinis]